MGAVSKDGGPPQPNQRIYNAKTGSHMQVTLNRAVQLWPTPRASEKDQGRETQASVRGEAEVKRGPTVTATALSMTLDTGKEQKPQGGGALNPEFVCWLMGYPEGWTDLDR